MGVMYYAALFPSILASVIAHQVALQLGGGTTAFTLSGVPENTDVLLIVKLVAFGVVCAGLSTLVCIIFHKIGHLFKHFLPNQYACIAVGGAVVVLISLLLGTRDYNGAGMQVIERAIAGHAAYEAFFLKLVLTAITIGVGYKGGEIVPGAVHRCDFLAPPTADFFGLAPSFAAGLGMTAVFCGVTNSPLTSILLAYELFGGQSLALFALVIAISYMLSGYYGLYSEQKIIYSKLRPQFIDRKPNNQPSVGRDDSARRVNHVQLLKRRRAEVVTPYDIRSRKEQNQCRISKVHFRHGRHAFDSMPVWKRLTQRYLCAVRRSHHRRGLRGMRGGFSQPQVAEYFLKRYPNLPLTQQQMLDGMDEMITSRYETIARPKDGVIDFLEGLRARGIKMAIATLTARRHAEKALIDRDMMKYFEFMLTIEDVGVPKYEPDIYLEAAKRLGLTAGECMVFEDAPYAGVTAKKPVLRSAAWQSPPTRRAKTRPAGERCVRRAFLCRTCRINCKKHLQYNASCPIIYRKESMELR